VNPLILAVLLATTPASAFLKGNFLVEKADAFKDQGTNEPIPTAQEEPVQGPQLSDDYWEGYEAGKEQGRKEGWQECHGVTTPAVPIGNSDAELQRRRQARSLILVGFAGIVGVLLYALGTRPRPPRHVSPKGKPSC